jgi:hypothetical protein
MQLLGQYVSIQRENAMSCWVVPSVAAELWGVTVADIQMAIHDGSLPSKTENGFTFIDVAPDSPVLETPRAFRPPAPPTYRAVTHEEIAALVGNLADSIDEEAEVENWRIGRSEAGRMRRPPDTLAA